jgi:hypothetical protein
MKNFNVVYVVINEGEPVYASKGKSEADAYAFEKNRDANNRALGELGVDDPDIDDCAMAGYKAGYDGEYYEVKRVNLQGKCEDDSVELDDGTEVDVYDINELLKLNN